jgi:glycine hydroxymethyltransferase
MIASGLRIGTPAVTTRGMGLDAMDSIGDLMAKALAARENPTELTRIRKDVATLATSFPLYPRRLQAARA